MVKILSRSHENLLRYIVYRAVLLFTQLQEVSYHSPMQGGCRCWKIPHCHHHNQSRHHHLYCPPHQQHQKQKTPESIIHECIRNHPKTRLHIFHPHNAWQWWSGELELVSLKLQNKIWDQFGYQTLLFCEVETPTLFTSSTHYSSPSPLS